MIRLWMTIYIVDASVVYTVRYIPVAVATYDSIPIMISAGMKTIPGPRPLKEAKIEPKNDTATI